MKSQPVNSSNRMLDWSPFFSLALFLFAQHSALELRFVLCFRHLKFWKPPWLQPQLLSFFLSLGLEQYLTLHNPHHQASSSGAMEYRSTPKFDVWRSVMHLACRLSKQPGQCSILGRLTFRRQISIMDTQTKTSIPIRWMRLLFNSHIVCADSEAFFSVAVRGFNREHFVTRHGGNLSMQCWHPTASSSLIDQWKVLFQISLHRCPSSRHVSSLTSGDAAVHTPCRVATTQMHIYVFCTSLTETLFLFFKFYNNRFICTRHFQARPVDLPFTTSIVDLLFLSCLWQTISFSNTAIFR